MNEAAITLKNGQIVGYAEYGIPSGLPLFSFHGTPGSRMFSKVYDSAAQAAGIRIIAPERPGYGRSSLPPNSYLIDYPDQIAEIADHLGIGQFAVVGTSGGGMYAVACANKLPERVTVAGVVSGMMSFYLPDAMRGMIIPNRALFSLARFAPGLTGFLFRKLLFASLATADKHIKNGTSPAPDITPEAFAIVVADVRAALGAGGAGLTLELVNLWRKLEFQLEDIRVPVYVWHGEADVNAPVTSGRYLAARIPNCRATFYPGEGHAALLKHSTEIMQTLAATTTP